MSLGTCRFCGQVLNIDGDTGEDAWEYCDCIGASAERQTQEQLIKARANIDALFGGGNECEHPEYPPVSENVIAQLKKLAELTAHGEIESVKIALGDKRGSGAITIGGKGQIKVSRAMARSLTLEA